MAEPRRYGRLAVFVPTLAGGGAQRSTLTLAGGIAGRGFDVDLVLARACGPFVDEVPSSVRIVDLGCRRVLASIVPLARYLRRRRPDAMLSVLNYANVAALWAARLSGIPVRVVASERTTVSAKWSAHWSPGRALMVRLMRRTYRSAHGLVAVSDGVRDDLSLLIGMPREAIHTIYNPVMREELRASAEAPLDHPWFAPGAVPVVLGVGSLKAQKGFATLVRAFAQVHQTRPARLLILGEGPERARLESLVQSLGCATAVSLPGFVGNPYAYMRRASLFVLASRAEGLPGTLIEALCCGVRVVSTDCPSGPREILQDGKYGQLVPVGDVDAMAEAIEHGLMAGRGGAAAPESWQRFELETVVTQYVEMLFPQHSSEPLDRAGIPVGPEPIEPCAQ